MNIRLTGILNRIDNSIRLALRFMERQRSLGFSEATHRMNFPKKSGFTGGSEEHEGKVFQLTVIINALLDASSAGFEVNWEGIEKDITYILNMKSRVSGGWKYFPSLTELPPDADDLAQILQVLSRYEWSDISTYCDDAISLIFNQNPHRNGSFETWIIDYSNNDIDHQKMLYAIETKWGKEPDVEVMANFLYALYLYNPDQFDMEIKNGLNFIIKNQEKNGYWNSTWYWGKYYGSYICSRIISTLSPTHESLNHTYRFIINSQNEDGGWGHQQSNAIDTAFGLLTLINLQNSKLIDVTIFLNAINYLLNNQSDKGHWEGTDFIRMNVRRAQTLKRSVEPSYISYKSNTITTAFCLQALCAVFSRT